MTTYRGICVGGPHDGQMLAHWATERKFYKPMFEYSMRKSLEDLSVEAAPIGHYTWDANDAGLILGKPFWQWVPA